MKTYSFRNVSVIFGTHEVVGFADGDDVVTIEPASDGFTKIVGAKGEVSRAAVNDESVTVKLKLQQTSSSVPVLQNLYLADKASGAGVLPMLVNDLETGESFTIKNAWIKKQPSIVRGQNQNPYEIELDGDVLIPVVL